MRKRRSSFTLVELVIVIIILAVVAVTAVVFLKGSVQEAQKTEAIVVSKVIRDSEIARKMDGNAYVAANNTAEVNANLALSILPKYFDFRVVNVTDDNFLVIAERLIKDLEGESSKPVVMAMDKSGIVPYVPPAPTGSSAGGGGSRGGGGGGAGGSSSGAGGAGSPAGGGGGTGGGGGSGSSGTAGVDKENARGSEAQVITYDNTIAAALELLKNSPTGLYYYDLIISNNIPISFVPKSDAYGEYFPDITYNPVTKQRTSAGIGYIEIAKAMETKYPPEAVASVICHEATHADFVLNSDKWITQTMTSHGLTADQISIIAYPFYSIDQEYHAMDNGCDAWNELTDNTDVTHVEFDNRAAIFAQSEADAKIWVTNSYQSIFIRNYGKIYEY